MRLQLGRMGGGRGPWIACTLLLASVLLTGCHKTSATSSAASATSVASSASAQATSSASSTPTATAKSADVSWTPPTTNTNGSALTDLAGYQIQYGTSPNALNQSVNVPNAGATDYVVQGLTTGTWYFAVVAYTNTGLQSSLSSIVSKTIS